MSLSTRFSQASPLRILFLLAPTSVGLAAWAVGILGGFQASDGLVYDALLRFRAQRVEDSSRVLLLEIDDTERHRFEEDLPSILQKLNQLGAKLIIIGSLPHAAPESFWAVAEALGKVVVGVSLVPSPDDASRLVPLTPPELERRRGIQMGIVADPPATGGVCRTQEANSTPGQLPLLETVAATQALGAGWSAPAGPYLIDFRGGPGSLPNVSAQRLLAGDLIPELVTGRCVLVGTRAPAIGSGFHTPTTALRRMALLEYQGHALNTLLADRVIREPGSLTRLAIIFSLLFFCAWVSRRVTLQLSFWLTLVVIGFHALISAMALVGFRTWLPVSENVVALVALMVFTVRGRAIEVTASLKSLISESAGTLKDKCWPVHGQDVDTTWSLVAGMIDQTLDLKRLIFLQAHPGSSQLKAILALRCSTDDIAERRRDSRRPPYKDAINAKGPIVVENFLGTPEKGERQYLLPLVFSGELLGFWAIGIDSAKIAAIPEFEGLLVDYTSRMGELLHQARDVSQSGGTDATARISFGAGGSSEPQSNLRSTLSLLQHRLGALDVLINSLDAGVVVFDIFGRILQINENMLSLLKKESLVPFEMSALDIIMTLSDFDLSRARKLLRRVIVESLPVSFPVKLRSSPGRRYLFHLKPLREISRKDERGRSRQGGARSILCELVDTTSMATLHEMKHQLTGKLCTQLRNDLATIDLSWSLLGAGAVSQSHHREMAELIQTKVRQTVRMLSDCQQYLSVETDVDDLERFPVDPRGLLTAAIEELKADRSQKMLSFRLMEPRFVCNVFASVTRLKELFKAILAVLCQDATESSTILVRVTQNDGVVAFDFSNLGFGIPNEVLQQYVLGEQAAASPELQTIQAGAKWVQAWGGMFEAFSGVGVGMHFTIHLVIFL